jgi:hypothetical protein
VLLRPAWPRRWVFEDGIEEQLSRSRRLARRGYV